MVHWEVVITDVNILRIRGSRVIGVPITLRWLRSEITVVVGLLFVWNFVEFGGNPLIVPPCLM